MYLSRRLNRSFAPPDWLTVNLTLQCNLKCTMCTTCYDVPDELSTAEIKGLIDQAALWGVKVFNPLGGELFMRGDLEELLEYACRKDFYITITTNGTLINKRRAQTLARIPSEKLHLNLSLTLLKLEQYAESASIWAAMRDEQAILVRATWLLKRAGYEEGEVDDAANAKDAELHSVDREENSGST